MKKGLKVSLIVCASLFGAGIIFWGIGAAVLGGDITSVGQKYEFTQKTEVVKANDISEISVNDRNNSIHLTPSSDLDNEIRITYYESDKDKYEINSNENVLNVEYQDKRQWYEYLYPSFWFDDHTITIELPKQYKNLIKSDTALNDIINSIATSFNAQNNKIQKIDLDTTNGAITAENLLIPGNLYANTTNGNITFNNIYCSNKAQTSLVGSTTNGSLSAKNVITILLELKSTNGETSANDTNVEELKLNTTNGRVLFDNLFVSKSVYAHTTNGDITGTINDSASSFTIDSDTTLGDNNLTSHGGSGPKKLSASTTHGDINITFLR